jgi:hypothetical protein
MVGPVFLLQTVRWWVLMAARRLGVGLWPALRLYFAAAFCNYCMPGLTGGDVLKAYYAARDSERRTDAVMSVVVDRIAGMLGLVVLAGVAGLFVLEQPLARQVTAYVWIGILGLAAGGLAYSSEALRRWLRVGSLVSRLPAGALLRQVDQAALAYRDHGGAVALAVVLSVFVRVCLVLATASSAYALGGELPVGLMLAIVPIIFMAGAVPISYQGLGVMEGLGMALLGGSGGLSANQIVGTLLLVRVYPMFYALLGALFLIKGDLRMRPPGTASNGAAAAGSQARLHPPATGCR